MAVHRATAAGSMDEEEAGIERGMACSEEDRVERWVAVSSDWDRVDPVAVGEQLVGMADWVGMSVESMDRAAQVLQAACAAMTWAAVACWVVSDEDPVRRTPREDW